MQDSREERKPHQRADDYPRPKEKEAVQNVRKGLKHNTECQESITERVKVMKQKKVIVIKG